MKKISVARKVSSARTVVQVSGWVVARPAGRRKNVDATIKLYLQKKDAVQVAGKGGSVRSATLLVGLLQS